MHAVWSKIWTMKPSRSQRGARRLFPSTRALLRSTGQCRLPNPDPLGYRRLWMFGSAPKLRYRARLASAS